MTNYEASIFVEGAAVSAAGRTPPLVMGDVA